jgi:hypothetical protein
MQELSGPAASNCYNETWTAGKPLPSCGTSSAGVFIAVSGSLLRAMNLKRLRHSILAIWLGLFTLTVISVQQLQLSTDVVAAAAADAQAPGQTPAVAAHHPDGCPNAGGHTHKGHADCKVCGVLAALTAVTLPVLLLPAPPSALASAAPVAAPVASRAGLPAAPYESRGPPYSA